MRLSVRSTPVALLAGALLATACKDDSSGPGVLPADRLPGFYQCTRATAFFSAATELPNGPGTYQFSPCRIYGNYTTPERRDSIEVYDFELQADSTVHRLDFPIGQYSYDRSTGLLTITNPANAAETYEVSGTADDVVLGRTLAFDFDGDAVTDTVRLTFLQR